MHTTNGIVIAHSNQKFVAKLAKNLNDKYAIISNNTDNGFQALRYIIQYNPKLVIIGADLPNLNATDIIKCINKKERSTTFIVITTDKYTKLPCVSETKNTKSIPCHTQVVKATWSQNNFTPIVSLIDQLYSKQNITMY